jgi:hypothetical protein
MSGIEKYVEPEIPKFLTIDELAKRPKYLGGFPRDEKFLDRYPMLKKVVGYYDSLRILGSELYNRFC